MYEIYDIGRFSISKPFKHVYIYIMLTIFSLQYYVKNAFVTKLSGIISGELLVLFTLESTFCYSNEPTSYRVSQKKLDWVFV